MLGGLIADLRSTTKPIEKVAILKAYFDDHCQTEVEADFFKYLIEQTFDDSILFHLKLDSRDLPTPGDEDIGYLEDEVTELLDFLSDSHQIEVNRSKAMEVLSYLGRGSQDLLLGVINKDWKAGMGIKQINKAFPGMIETFEVQLANKWNPDKHYAVQEWWGSPKMDGLRAVSLRDPSGNWLIKSRTGKILNTCSHMIPYLEENYQKTGISFVDGEVYIPGERFETIQGNAMRSSHGADDRLQYHIFMCGKAEDFKTRSHRGFMASNVLTPGLGPLVEVQEIAIPNNSGSIMEATAEFIAAGYEGAMLRNPWIMYDWKRSDALLKVKLFDSSECRVQRAVVGPYLVSSEGQQLMEDMVVSLSVIQPNGIDCGIGSGMTLIQRRAWYIQPSDIIGKTVEIQHQGLGNDGRMRFPVIKAIRYDK